MDIKSVSRTRMSASFRSFIESEASGGLILMGVAFLIVPIFGFANAGMSFSGMELSKLADPIPLGVAAGLFFGKQIGVFSFAWLAIEMRLCERPADVTWVQLYGVAVLCGIGFTMSLFIGLLAYDNSPSLQEDTKLGVLFGSLLSAIVGTILLRLSLARPAKEKHGRA